MPKKSNSNGFSVVEVLVVIVVVTLLALGGFYVAHKKNDKKVDSTTKSQTASSAKATTKPDTNNPVQTDPSDGGKYLVISEWNKRVLLPSDLQGKVSYIYNSGAGEPDPDTGLPLQNARIYVTANTFTDNGCAITTTSLGNSVVNASSGEHFWTGHSTEAHNLDGTHGWHLETNGRDGVVFYAEVR